MEALHTAVLILHVFGATIIIGVAFVTLVIEIKKYTSKEVLALTELIWKISGPLIGLQLLTGLYLAGSEWDKIRTIPYFWIKLVLFFVVGLSVGIINQRRFERIKAGLAGWGNPKWSWIGFLAFTTIAVLGVMVAESTTATP